MQIIFFLDFLLFHLGPNMPMRVQLLLVKKEKFKRFQTHWRTIFIFIVSYSSCAASRLTRSSYGIKFLNWLDWLSLVLVVVLDFFYYCRVVYMPEVAIHHHQKAFSGFPRGCLRLSQPFLVLPILHGTSNFPTLLFEEKKHLYALYETYFYPVSYYPFNFNQFFSKV